MSFLTPNIILPTANGLNGRKCCPKKKHCNKSDSSSSDSSDCKDRRRPKRNRNGLNQCLTANQILAAQLGAALTGLLASTPVNVTLIQSIINTLSLTGLLGIVLALTPGLAAGLTAAGITIGTTGFGIGTAGFGIGTSGLLGLGGGLGIVL